MQSLCCSTQKHPGKDQGCRLDLQAGGCPFPFPTAAVPPQRQFLFLAPCRLNCIRTLVLGAVAFICRGCCFITIMLTAITQEETVFVHSSLAQKTFFQGFFHFPELVLTWSLAFSFLLWCFILHSPTQTPAQTSSPLPLHTLQVLLLWNKLTIKIFNVSVTRHHKWVYLCHTVILHDNSKQYEGEEYIIIL